MKLLQFTLLIAAPTLLAHSAFARLGETEAQSQARYGAPVESMVGSDEKPLMPGAIERAYNFDGWRIRAAFAGGTTVRIQYVHIENSTPKRLTGVEMKTILDAEKGLGSWREERSKNIGIAADLEKAFKAGLSLNKWERTDHARAELVLGIAMQFETHDAAVIEKKLAKTAPQRPGGPAAAVPKF